MIGRKLALVRSGGEISSIYHVHPFVPELQKIKNATLKNTKKLGYIIIYITLRFFIKSSNLIKNTSILIVEKLKNKFKKNKGSDSMSNPEKKEVSGYLKVISEYRHKIRKMKHIIKEEEGIE
jgi:hypothetical protein